MSRKDDRRRQAPLLLVATGGAAAYVLVLLVLPFLEPQLDVVSTHPEDYAAGRYGILVNFSYGAFGLALAAIALALWPGRSWRAAGLMLLAPPAVLCAALTIAPVAVAGSGMVVFIAILGLALGPVVISIVLRDRFGSAYGLLVALGVAVLVAFVGLAAAPEAIGGAVNRGFDVLAGLWVAAAALDIRSE
jgi:hypothetical protein